MKLSITVALEAQDYVAKVRTTADLSVPEVDLVVGEAICRSALRAAVSRSIKDLDALEKLEELVTLQPAAETEQ